MLLAGRCVLLTSLAPAAPLHIATQADPSHPAGAAVLNPDCTHSSCFRSAAPQVKEILGAEIRLSD